MNVHPYLIHNCLKQEITPKSITKWLGEKNFSMEYYLARKKGQDTGETHKYTEQKSQTQE